MNPKLPAASIIFGMLAVAMLAGMVTGIADGTLKIKTCFEDLHLVLLVFFCLAAVFVGRKNSN
jgi:hypothetical protein